MRYMRYHIHSDGLGHTYVFIITEDEQIEIKYTGKDVRDCEEWIERNAVCEEFIREHQKEYRERLRLIEPNS